MSRLNPIPPDRNHPVDHAVQHGVPGSLPKLGRGFGSGLSLVSHPAAIPPSTDDSQHISDFNLNEYGADAGREQAAAVTGGQSTPNTASVLLPLPVSANRIWMRVGKRIIKNPRYVQWQAIAARIIKAAELDPIEGTYALSIILPVKTRCDADNYIKGVSDLLQRAKLITDDKYCRTITVLRGAEVPAKHCLVTVSETRN